MLKQVTKKRSRVQLSESLKEASDSLSSQNDVPAQQVRKVKRIVSSKEESKEAVKQGATKVTQLANSKTKGANFELEKKSMHRIILWLRNDLRMHDNPVLNWAASQPKLAYKEVVPVFCFDPRFYDRRVEKYQTKKCGIIRTRFNIEAVNSLRESLEKIDSNLLVSHAKPEDFLLKLVAQSPMNTTVVFQQEICSEERKVEDKVIESLLKANKDINFVSLWGSTLHHIDDLPYNPLEYFPHVYGNFRKAQVNVKVRDLLPTPASGELPKLKSENATKDEMVAFKFLPGLEEFGFTKAEIEKKPDARACLKFEGSEESALTRLEDYVFKTRSVATY
jgi:deoxyribodipyrimidine photo-lyase